MPESFLSSLDRYIVERPYAEGGMGVTFLVRSEKTGQRLILKQLRLDRVSDWKMVELFERESEVLRQLSHPQIPRYIDSFSTEDKKQFCLVQSFIEGRTLQQMIDTSAPLDAEQYESYLRQCLEILAYLQELVPPVVHRDITPKNIIVHDRKAFLVDFGSVKSAMNRESLTTNVGTFGFMPPEQIMGRAAPASDVYSLAMTFIALGSHSDPSLLPLDNSTGQVNVRRILSHLPETMILALEGMTEMGLDKRIGSAREALQTLTRRTKQARPQPDQIVSAPRKTTLRIPIPSKVWIYSGAGGILLLAGLLLPQWAKDDPRNDPSVAVQPGNQYALTAEKPKKESVAQAVMPIRDAAAFAGLLTGSSWIGKDGFGDARWTFRVDGGRISAKRAEWDRRTKTFSNSPASVAINILDGTLTMVAKRTNDGVAIEDTYYGMMTADSLFLSGTGETLYRQAGSEYTTPFTWQFKRSATKEEK